MNRKIYALIAAASLGAGGVCFAQQTSGQQQAEQAQESAQTSGQNAAQQADSAIQGSRSLMQQFPQQGVKNVEQQKNEQAIDEVAKLAECSLQGDLKTCGQQLTEQSQQRLGLSDVDNTQVRQAADQLQKNFKEKYNQELAIRDQGRDIFGNAEMVVAEVSDPEQLAGLFPLPNRISQAQQAGYQQEGQSGQSKKNDQAQVQLKQGDKIAAMQLRSGQNPSKSVTVSLVEENGQWRVCPSPEIQNGNELAQSLVRHIQMVDQRKDQWPSDARQAQAVITRHILMAYSEPPMGAGAQQSGFESGSQQREQNSQGQAQQPQ